jgi:uncharacterized protein YpmB
VTYPPQPSGQQDPYGQYGQQPPGQYGPPPGGPPPKRKRGVIIAIVVVGVLVLAGVGVTVYLLTKSDNPTTSAPNQTGTTTGSTGTGNPGGGDAASLSAAATKYVDAVNGADEAAAKAVMCDSSTPGLLYEENAGKGDVRTGDAELISKTAGVVSITLADSNALAVPLAFEFTDGAWCVQF